MDLAYIACGVNGLCGVFARLWGIKTTTRASVLGARVEEGSEEFSVTRQHPSEPEAGAEE